jgi:hypothetical protein
MSKLENDLEKFEKARKDSAEEEAKMIRAVDRYLEAQTTEGRSAESVRRYYMRKYIDFLDASAVQPLNKRERHKPLTPEQKLAIIKRQIYMHEIRPEEKKKSANLQNVA